MLPQSDNVTVANHAYVDILLLCAELGTVLPRFNLLQLGLLAIGTMLMTPLPGTIVCNTTVLKTNVSDTPICPQ